MHATLARPTATSVPPSIPPTVPPIGAAAAPGEPDDEGLDAYIEATRLRTEEGETASGCDWPEGPTIPGGCRW